MNISVAKYHFPVFKVQQPEKWLYNPVLKKRFKNRPEERVRLQWVEFLVNQTNWKSSRIGFEAPVKLRQEENAVRADLVLYDSKLKPQILIECKADHVSLGKGSAQQASRYNSEIGAEYIVLSNGVSDYIYHQNGDKLNFENLPIELNLSEQTGSERNAEYWSERGFCDLYSVQAEVLNNFYAHHNGSEIRYLNFKDSILTIPMDHYYRIYRTGESEKLAVGFLGYREKGSYLVVVLNQKGVNEALALLNLDQLLNQNRNEVTVYRKNNVVQYDVKKHLREILKKFRMTDHSDFTQELLKFF